MKKTKKIKMNIEQKRNKINKEYTSYLYELHKANKRNNKIRQTLIEAAQYTQFYKNNDATMLLSGNILTPILFDDKTHYNTVTICTGRNESPLQLINDILLVRSDMMRVDDLTRKVIEYEAKIDEIDRSSLSYKMSILNTFNELLCLSKEVGILMNHNFNYKYHVEEFVNRFIKFFKKEDYQFNYGFMFQQYQQVLKCINEQFDCFLHDEGFKKDWWYWI